MESRILPYSGSFTSTRLVWPRCSDFFMNSATRGSLTLMSWSFALFGLGTADALLCQFALVWFATRPPGITFTYRQPLALLTQITVWGSVAFNCSGCTALVWSVLLLKVSPDDVENDPRAIAAPKWAAIYGSIFGIGGCYVGVLIVFLYL